MDAAGALLTGFLLWAGDLGFVRLVGVRVQSATTDALDIGADSCRPPSSHLECLYDSG